MRASAARSRSSAPARKSGSTEEGTHEAQLCPRRRQGRRGGEEFPGA
jgi:hypothetical protein